MTHEFIGLYFYVDLPDEIKCGKITDEAKNSGGTLYIYDIYDIKNSGLIEDRFSFVSQEELSKSVAFGSERGLGLYLLELENGSE